jgi:C-terminal processing protease CtpA/Prc
MSMHYASPLGKLRIAVIICCLILILGIFGYAYIIDKNDSVIEKDDIIANVENLGSQDYGFSYVSAYVKRYGIGNVNTHKLNTVENDLEKYFYKPLPDEKTLAIDTCLLFVEYFYDEIDLNDKTQVTDAVLKCLLASIGDPYAYYRTAEEYIEFLNSLQGSDEFVGIGVMMNQETLEVLMVYEDSGAQEAGIMSGDIIYGV